MVTFFNKDGEWNICVQFDYLLMTLPSQKGQRLYENKKEKKEGPGGWE